MDGAIDSGIDTSRLALLGIGDVEERVYCTLLKRRRAPAAVIADDLAITLDDATGLLEHLESLGLGTHLPESPKAYVAVEPELAIDALIKQHQRTLEQARTVVPTLAKTFAQASVDDAGQQLTLELINNRAHLESVLARMLESSCKEILSFQKAPVLVPATRSISAAAGARGIRRRTVSDESHLKLPGKLASLGEDIARGEEARTFSTLPFKMLIVDRSIAIITLESQRPDAPTLQIHRSALLEALCLLFEFVWGKATPIVTARHGEVKMRSDGNGHGIESAQALLPLLSAGLNDKAIAQELNISASTLNRRMGDLMSIYGARTRFQLGLQVARLNDVASQSSPVAHHSRVAHGMGS
jgi:sugar-specific transcriptional regulator TrmB